MLHVVAANEDETAPPVHGGLVDHCQPRLASAGCPAAEPPTAEPPHQPEGDCEQNEHRDQGDQHLESAGSIAEQGFQDHSSLRPRGTACRSGLPEVLTPVAMRVALNTNKELRKIGPDTPVPGAEAFSW
jgi:hypothetical protein